MSLKHTSQSSLRPAFKVTSIRPTIPSVRPSRSTHTPSSSSPNITPTPPPNPASPSSPPTPSPPNLTEIRGPYHNAAFGPHVLADTLALTAPWVDGLKFAGGAFTLMPSHASSTSPTHTSAPAGSSSVSSPQATTASAMSSRIWAELVRCVRKNGLKPKPELGIQWGAGGDASVADLESAGTSDVGGPVDAAETLLDAAADMLMIESEGITENVKSWRTDVLARIIHDLPLDKLHVQSRRPESIRVVHPKNHGVDVNLFVDHSQAVQLACLRAGIWGTNQTFGRVVNYRPWKS